MIHYDLLRRSSFDEEIKYRPRGRQVPSFAALLRKSRRVCRPLYVLIGLALFLFWQTTFNASYTNPPPFTIHPNETVFIAANIINGDLINGPWGKSVQALVDLIGKDRVFVSIYGGTAAVLEVLDSKLSCNRTLVAEDISPISLEDIPRTLLPTGEERISRIAYLAEVRNKALEPLATSDTHFDKLLFINDVFFEPMDAARLLWGTNVKDGKSKYKAVCGADFVTSWKYYDTFATRDLEGYSIGVPIFPWFAGEGKAVSRKDVLAGKDAVRVKSCWGGIVAFDAKYFRQGGVDVSEAQSSSPTTSLPQLPLRFRSEPESFWDSSECCLIHADIMSLPDSSSSSSSSKSTTNDDEHDFGIYMNPFVRVSYDAKSFGHIAFVKRFERLFTFWSWIINYFAHMPRFNARRTEVEGEVIKDRLWISSNATNTTTANNTTTNKQDRWASRRSYPRSINARSTAGKEGEWEEWKSRGHYEDYNRTATRGGYCGVRQLLVLKEGKLEVGEGNWENLLSTVPPLETKVH